MIAPENATQSQGVPSFMLNARTIRMIPEATSENPSTKSQHRRGEQRVLERDEARDNVENAEQEPKQELAPGLDLERIDDFGRAGDQHHDPNHEHSHDGCKNDAAKRNKSGDHVDNSKSDDPARFGAKRFKSRRESVGSWKSLR